MKQTIWLTLLLGACAPPYDAPPLDPELYRSLARSAPRSGWIDIEVYDDAAEDGTTVVRVYRGGRWETLP